MCAIDTHACVIGSQYAVCDCKSARRYATSRYVTAATSRYVTAAISLTLLPIASVIRALYAVCLYAVGLYGVCDCGVCDCESVSLVLFTCLSDNLAIP